MWDFGRIPNTRVRLERKLRKPIKDILIYISIKIDVVEIIQIGVECILKDIASFSYLFKEFHDVFTWSYETILGIDPSIVEHVINTYVYAKLGWKRIIPVHPQKLAAIKEKNEKFLEVGFIYLIPLIEWVFNVVLVKKKQGNT